MDAFVIIGIVVLGLTIIALVCYMTLTDRIISDQQREIDTLKAQLRRNRVTR